MLCCIGFIFSVGFPSVPFIFKNVHASSINFEGHATAVHSVGGQKYHHRNQAALVAASLFLPLPSTTCHVRRQSQRWMKDVQVEKFVRDELESAAALGVRATPIVVLNGIHTMHLVGADQLRNFKLFIDSGMAPQPLYYPAGGVESVWAPIERGGTGGEGADHDKNDIRTSRLGRSVELIQDNAAVSVTM